MTTVFPGSIDSLPRPTANTKTNAGAGLNLSTVVDNISDAIEATETKLGTGSSTPARGKALVASGTGSSIWDVLKRRNRLLNGAFRVKQLGTLGTADNSYHMDGWRLLLEAANAAAVAQETADVPSDGAKYGCRLTVGSGEDNKFGIVQAIEYADCADLRGKKVSLQAKIKATAAITDVRMAVISSNNTLDSGAAGVDPISSWGSAGTNPTLASGFAYLGTPANLSPTTSWATYRSENLTVPADANNLLVMIWCEDETTTVTTDIMRITDVQLEEGEVCSDVDRPPMAQEENRAKRYWQQSYAGGTAVATATDIGTEYFLISDNTNSKTLSMGIRYPVEMRVAPTIVLYDANGNSGKISTLNAGGTPTHNVTPSVGALAIGSNSVLVIHTGTIAGMEFHYTANARM